MLRRSFLQGLIASPFVIRASGVLMPLSPFTDYKLVSYLDPATFHPYMRKVPLKWHLNFEDKWVKIPDYAHPDLEIIPYAIT